MPVSADVLQSLLGTRESQSLAASFTRITPISVARSPVVDG